MPTGKPLSTIYGPNPTENLQMANKQYVDSGGVSENTFARVVKKIDEIVSNSTTLQDDNELFVALNANKTYGYILSFGLNSSAIADIKYLCSVPPGASATFTNGNISGSNLVNIGDVTVSVGRATSGVDQVLLLVGRIIVVGTAGNFQFRWSQNNLEVSDTKILQGSYLVIWEELP